MNSIKIDFITNTIIVTRAFYKEAQEYGTEEYAMLQNAKAENPYMTISIRTVNKSGKSNSSKGLTYRYMRKFISIMDADNLKTFENTILYYEGLYIESAVVYQEVKNWFLSMYPHHRDMVVLKAPTAAESSSKSSVLSVADVA